MSFLSVVLQPICISVCRAQHCLAMCSMVRHLPSNLLQPGK
jgi:hypothetical protein